MSTPEGPRASPANASGDAPTVPSKARPAVDRHEEGLDDPPLPLKRGQLAYWQAVNSAPPTVVTVLRDPSDPPLESYTVTRSPVVDPTPATVTLAGRHDAGPSIRIKLPAQGSGRRASPSARITGERQLNGRVSLDTARAAASEIRSIHQSPAFPSPSQSLHAGSPRGRATVTAPIDMANLPPSIESHSRLTAAFRPANMDVLRDGVSQTPAGSSPSRMSAHLPSPRPVTDTGPNTPVSASIARGSSVESTGATVSEAGPSGVPLAAASGPGTPSLVSRDAITAVTSTNPHDADGDEMMKEAAEGLQSRLRPSRAARDNQKAGVSASGKGVKLGGIAKGAGPAVVRRKGKGADLPNQDFCSACRGIGRFLCCDGCPRSFHFMCLEPPLRIDELPEEETWYCKKCQAERQPKSASAPVLTPQSAHASTLKPIVMIFDELVRKVDEENPEQFRLPQELRTYFAGVGTSARGDYVDADETRTRMDRKGFQEERDGTRLRDGKHRLVSCYVCGGSSIPLYSIAADPEASWRQLVSCDYCALHWHLDCLNPPLASMPNSGRKWMCPNHAEQVMQPRRRTVREGVETVDIDSPAQRNNGNIIIIPEDAAKQQLECEDMIINKRKYRVPERIIRLNFWNKVLQKRDLKRKRVSDSSPASTESDDEPAREPSKDEVEAANLILSLTQPQQLSERPSERSGNKEVTVKSQANGTTPSPPPTVSNDSGPPTPRIMLRLSRPANVNGHDGAA